MITIPFKNKGAFLYVEIYEFIKQEITEGNLKYGEKLPSKRSLASHLSVSVNTVDAAYGQLVAEGYLEASPKRGYFVCQIDTYLLKQKNRVLEKTLKKSKQDQLRLIFRPMPSISVFFPMKPFAKFLSQPSMNMTAVS